ncbi:MULTISPECIES: hypothetical protein [Bacillaceae]|uniref:Nudix hydrolase domain-containing protein n=1 Tax=Evansella alkalicola TaxID=745819 RepID=A0ABS6JY39_9BACI|nr:MULTISPECIES: hypothetical protein [Bacillaceae]MBU9723518.1 hypothetical protein [Bacillus alkalicola]
MEAIREYFYEIPVFGDLLEYIFSIHPMVGTIIIVVSVILAINKFFIVQFDLNMLKPLFQYFRGMNKDQRYNREREIFYKTASTEKFADWQNKVLIKIYDDLEMVKLFGKSHLAVVHRVAHHIGYPLSGTMEKIAVLKNPQVKESTLDKYQSKYYKVMKANIKKPNLVGFELDEYKLNDKQEILGFSANACTYKQTVTTSHILEYELYRLYKRNKSIVKKSGNEILKKLHYRSKIHEGQTNSEVVLKGQNRHSLLSVQMIIFCWDEKKQTYRVPIIKRSEEVAIKPNYWHIVPAGGFEIFEKEETTNKGIIEDNFDVELTLYRELLEEVFNGRDYESNDEGEVNDIIHKHPVIEELDSYLKNQEAHLEFLGNVTDMMSLRQELSFLLVIDNSYFIKKNFKVNFEGVDFQLVKANKLIQMLEDELLYPSSAGLLALAKESKLIKERELLQDL